MTKVCSAAHESCGNILQARRTNGLVSRLRGQPVTWTVSEGASVEHLKSQSTGAALYLGKTLFSLFQSLLKVQRRRNTTICEARNSFNRYCLPDQSRTTTQTHGAPTLRWHPSKRVRVRLSLKGTEGSFARSAPGWAIVEIWEVFILVLLLTWTNCSLRSGLFTGRDRSVLLTCYAGLSWLPRRLNSPLRWQRVEECCEGVKYIRLCCVRSVLPLIKAGSVFTARVGRAAAVRNEKGEAALPDKCLELWLLPRVCSAMPLVTADITDWCPCRDVSIGTLDFQKKTCCLQTTIRVVINIVLDAARTNEESWCVLGWHYTKPQQWIIFATCSESQIALLLSAFLRMVDPSQVRGNTDLSSWFGYWAGCSYISKSKKKTKQEIIFCFCSVIVQVHSVRSRNRGSWVGSFYSGNLTWLLFTL